MFFTEQGYPPGYWRLRFLTDLCGRTGKLAFTGQTVETESPVCVVFS